MTTIYPNGVVRTLTGHSEPGSLSDKNLIVLHITQGSSAASAIATFQQSQHPNRVSAHFVIDRDGTVYQLLDLSDIAWHASEVNSRSIGIEHAAIADSAHYKAGEPIPPAILPVTDEQYQASAQLLAWLSKTLNIPIDREHIKGHFEASPSDGHVLCCSGALDIDNVVGLAHCLAG